MNIEGLKRIENRSYKIVSGTYVTNSSGIVTIGKPDLAYFSNMNLGHLLPCFGIK